MRSRNERQDRWQAGSATCGSPGCRGSHRRADRMRRQSSCPPAALSRRGRRAYQADLAYAHCMQTHGVPDFPDPNPSGHARISISGQPPANSPAGRAYDACKHLLTVRQHGNGQRRTDRDGQPAGVAATDCLAAPRVTHPSSSGWPTASSRCWTAGSTAAASRWCCPRRPKRGRRGPSRSPTS